MPAERYASMACAFASATPHMLLIGQAHSGHADRSNESLLLGDEQTWVTVLTGLDLWTDRQNKDHSAGTNAGGHEKSQNLHSFLHIFTTGGKLNT